MANATNATITVETILAMAIENLAPNLDNVRAELEAHNSESDKFKPIVNAQRKIDAGNGWANLDDQFRAELEISEKYNNPVLLANARANMELLGEFRKWETRRERLEQEIESGIAPIRELVVGLNAVTGDRTVHKTHERGGNKSGANGERIHHGNMCQIIRMSDNTVMTYESENGEEHDVWKSINNACKTLTPRKIDEVTGEEKPYINQNGKACERALRKYGYEVKFLAQDN